MTTPEKLIATIRDSFIGSQHVYTEGSCLHFHFILKEVFPTAKPYYDMDHVITEIDGKYYDITGEVKLNSNMTKFDEPPHYSLKAPFNIYTINKN